MPEKFQAPEGGYTLTDEQIDLIAADGMRNAAGGIYESSVHQFARACISAATEALQARIRSLSREAWDWSKALEAQLKAEPAKAPAEAHGELLSPERIDGFFDDFQKARSLLGDLEAFRCTALDICDACQPQPKGAQPHGWVVWWPKPGGGYEPIYKHGPKKQSYGRELDELLRHYPVYDVPHAVAQAPAPAHPTMTDAMRSFIEGMSVSVDVSTCDDDAGHRYFGTVTEVMDAPEDKHGVTLLVQDAEPNFSTQAPAVGADALPALRKLVEQIDKAEFVDENGHPIKMNVAYLAAKELL